MQQASEHAMVEALLIDLYPSMEFVEKTKTYTHFTIDKADIIELPLESLYDLLVTDFEMRFTVVFHTIGANKLIGTAFKAHLNKLPSGTFSFEETLFHLYKLNPKSLEDIKHNLDALITQSDRTTLLAFGNANMKATNAAKRLFIHRNTMQYRLDHIQEVTGIDVKTFKGLFIIHALQTL